MDFREYDIARDGDDVVVSGTIREPVTWDFTIRICGDDIPGMLRVGLNRETLSLAARWILHARSRPASLPAPAPVPLATARPRAAAATTIQVVGEDEPEELADQRSESLGTTPAPAPITHLRRPAPPQSPPPAGGTPVAAIARTPNFGAPRRRGWAPVDGQPVRAVAEGGRR